MFLWLLVGLNIFHIYWQFEFLLFWIASSCLLWEHSYPCCCSMGLFSLLGICIFCHICCKHFPQVVMFPFILYMVGVFSPILWQFPKHLHKHQIIKRGWLQICKLTVGFSLLSQWRNKTLINLKHKRLLILY